MTTRRIATSDLASAFQLMCDAAQKAGVAEAANWNLETGSKTYGRAYRVWLSKDDHTGAHYTPALLTNYLGMTAGEAYSAIYAMRSAFVAVIDAKEAGE